MNMESWKLILSLLGVMSLFFSYCYCDKGMRVLYELIEHVYTHRILCISLHTSLNYILNLFEENLYIHIYTLQDIPVFFFQFKSYKLNI